MRTSMSREGGRVTRRPVHRRRRRPRLCLDFISPAFGDKRGVFASYQSKRSPNSTSSTSIRMRYKELVS
ncbi:hypothetical protein EVAR_55935_1 [Eumeta japonica]|uniref:Uncharacterized protein n=1 Tax=Eumeta variegata TaxID=151549 RepID=A0A4C1Z0H8_EUMVA|nr:hypothetical protein EVAR_55935_1 [Eumeta japonica]